MFYRTLILSLFLMQVLVTGTLMITAGSAVAAPHVEVLLRGHDEPIAGYLRQISHARYLLQGSNVYYEFPQTEIVAVDGDQDIPESVRGDGRLIFSSFYEKLLPDGDVEVWSHNQITNDGIHILTGTDWGAAAWEADEVRTMRVYDNYSNELPVTVRPRGDGGFTVAVDFLVPVAPKESLGLTLKILRKNAARQDGDTWSYTFNVDFNEDRYLTRKIELPAGAELVETYAGSRGVQVVDRTILLSQRYYPAKTRDPLTVTYTLP